MFDARLRAENGSSIILKLSTEDRTAAVDA
jgi:hypothetical protein